MSENTWNEYSRLVLNELERLNENYERMREDFSGRFEEINRSLTEFKNSEKQIQDQKIWIEKVNDIWSPTQMQLAKDEIYKQKSKWVATIAIFTFIQILLGIIFSILNVVHF